MKASNSKAIFGTVLVGLTLLATLPAAAANVTGLGSPELNSYIESKMWQMRTPGLAVAVIKNDTIIWSKGFGWADIEHSIPVTADTPFYLASISKTFTATAIMQLWEQGFIGLDEDINNYLPFPVRNPSFPDIPITFRMLLGHDSSIHTREELIPTILGMDPAMSLEDWVASYLAPGGALFDPVLNFTPFAPGTHYEYCNIGYGLLGYLVERISGKPFDQYCNEHLFLPLGMTDTSWRIADFLSFSRAPAIPYIFNHTTGRYVPFGYNSIPNYPSATLNTSANQLAKWLVAHMNDGRYGGAQILQSATVELMQTPRYAGLVREVEGYTYGYGLGFEVVQRQPTDSFLTIGHGGLYFGAATEMHYRPEQRVGAIVLANAAGGIAVPSGPDAVSARHIIGRELTIYSVLIGRLLDEAATSD